jgi:hypothetical protein
MTMAKEFGGRRKLIKLANVCRHPSLRTTELSGNFRTRASHPLQLMMRVVMGAANRRR